MSDVFGSLVKQYTLGQTAAEADWLIGAGLLAPAVNGMALRSMKAPGTAYDDDVLGKDPQPATWTTTSAPAATTAACTSTPASPTTPSTSPPPRSAATPGSGPDRSGTTPAMAGQRSPSMAMSLQYVFAAIPIAGVIMLALQLRALARDWAAPGLRLGVALAVAVAAAVILTGRLVEVSPSAAVIALIATMALLIAVHMPIAFAVGIACVVYVVLRGELPLIVVPHRMIGGMDSFLLLAMPLFVLAGDLMNTGGITERLVGFARALVGHIRGGLGMTTVVSEYLFSGISGSSAADVSAVGSLLIPAMTRAGYRPELAVSIVAAASAMGVLVPPCLMMVVLASLTDLSVAALFMAGFLPAAAMALLLMGLIYVQARRRTCRASRGRPRARCCARARGARSRSSRR